MTNEFKPVDMIDYPTQGRRVYIAAQVEAVNGKRIICKNNAGYYYAVSPGEVYIRPRARWIRKGNKFICPDCGNAEKKNKRYCSDCGSEME